MMGVLFLPIILIVLIIILVTRATNGNRTGGKKRLGGKNIKVLLVSYLVILLASAILFAFIQQGTSVQGENSSAENMEELYEQFYTDIYEGKIPDKEAIEVHDEYEFDYDKDTLYVTADRDDYYGRVVIERNEALKDTIKVINYLTPMIVGHMDYTDEIPTIGVDMLEDTLRMEVPQPEHVMLGMIKKELTISQFTEEGSFFDNGLSYIGDPVLYLQIPENLEVISQKDEIYLSFVSE